MFEESALRNQTDAAPPPHWPVESQFACLVNPDPGPPISLAEPHTYSKNGYCTFEDGQACTVDQHTHFDFSAPYGYRPAAYDQDNALARASQAVAQNLGNDKPVDVEPAHSRPSLIVRTPTGPRSMRRPGLAGASAIINGQYWCQWAAHGAMCGQKFTDAKHLTDHIKTHHVRGAGHFECQWIGCDKGSFPTANKLVRHVHSHTGHKPFPCPTCSQAFVTKDQLDKHLTTHTGAKDFVCTWPGCGRSFAVKHALDGHVNSVHLKAKKHICPHCSQAFDDSSNLSKHKKQVHNKDTAIKCPARRSHGCTYVDSRKDKMKEHCERACHGLETVNDPHAWTMYVQQYKTASKRADARRQSRDICVGTPLSHASSISASPFPAPSRRSASIECTEQGCNLSLCLPCGVLCNDLHGGSHTGHCDQDDCDGDPCDPGCNDTDCDPSTRQPCYIPPCTLAHCPSTCSSPTQPATPLGVTGDYFDYHPFYGQSDMFQDHDHSFPLSGNHNTSFMGIN